MIKDYMDEFSKEIGNESTSETPCLECDEQEVQTESSNNEMDYITGILNEVGSSTVRITKKDKVAALSGLESLRLAKEKDDPLYKQYKMFRDKALKIKLKLRKKYLSRGTRAAKKALA